VRGISGFGDAVHDALRELADNLINEAVWVEIADEDELPPDPTNAANSSIETNVVELYRDRNWMCALLGTEDSTSVVAGFGDSAHSAIRDLAGKLVEKGIWVEVTDRREWHIEEPGCLDVFINEDEAAIRCNECDALIRTVPTSDLERTLTEMELTLDCRTEMCPHCKKVNVISGFSELQVYTCRECGEVVKLSDDPNVDRIFGP
jgi:hypothetical protein